MTAGSSPVMTTGTSPIGAKIGRLRDAPAPLSSWSGLARPSTSLFVARKEGVDGRHKAGHDDKPRRRATILAPMGEGRGKQSPFVLCTAMEIARTPPALALGSLRF